MFFDLAGNQAVWQSGRVPGKASASFGPLLLILKKNFNRPSPSERVLWQWTLGLWVLGRSGARIGQVVFWNAASIIFR